MAVSVEQTSDRPDRHAAALPPVSRAKPSRITNNDRDRGAVPGQQRADQYEHRSPGGILSNVPGMSSTGGQDPQPFALGWVQAAAAGQADLVWQLMSTQFRLAAVQGWIWHNPQALDDHSAAGFDCDSLAAHLSQLAPEHELFQHVVRVTLRDITEGFGDLDVDQLAAGSRPRPVGPGLELVRLVYLPDVDRDGEGNYSLAPGAWARNISVFVEWIDSTWAVAGVGEGILHPDRPPAFERLVGPGD